MVTKSKAPAYDPDKQYTVTLADRAEWRGRRLLPGPSREYVMSGDVVQLLADKIATAIESPSV